jgi:hypothetical protein
MPSRCVIVPSRGNKAATVRAWSPGIIHALLATLPGVAEDTAATRLKSRMDRQQRVLMRDDPPSAWFLVDEMSLYRRVGTAEAMAAQMRHLSAVTAMPNVTVQVLPAVAHPANASGFIVADDAAWCEHVAAGFVYTGETVSSLLRLFDSLRSESYRASESAALINRTCEAWATGASPLTPTPAAGTA